LTAQKNQDLILAVEDLLESVDTSSSPYTLEVLGEEEGETVIATLTPETEEQIERIYTILYGDIADDILSSGDGVDEG
jgi:hypothetical protein